MPGLLQSLMGNFMIRSFDTDGQVLPLRAWLFKYSLEIFLNNKAG